MAPPPPVWMEALAATVAECLHAHSPMGPLGFRYREEDGVWDLIVYPTPVELVGGAQEATVVLPGFSLDLYVFLSAFERLTALDWCAQGFGPSDSDGPCVSLEGRYQGHEVWLRVLAEPPTMKNPVCALTHYRQ